MLALVVIYLIRYLFQLFGIWIFALIQLYHLLCSMVLQGLFWWLSFGFLLLDACIFCYEFTLLKLQYYSVAVPLGSICTSRFFNEWIWWLNLRGLTTRFGKKRKRQKKLKKRMELRREIALLLKL